VSRSPKPKKPSLVPISFTFDPLVSEKFDERCATLRQSRSWAIRQAIAQWLARPIDLSTRRVPRGSL
jgi:hypothetical protein